MHNLSQLVTDEQDPATIQKLVNRVQELLTKDEAIEYIGVQKKPIVTFSPGAVVLTNRRFMIVHYPDRVAAIQAQQDDRPGSAVRSTGSEHREARQQGRLDGAKGEGKSRHNVTHSERVYRLLRELKRDQLG